MLDRRRVLRGAASASLASGAGVIALASLGLFETAGQPFGWISDTAIVVMILSLAPVMLAHYELGGLVPLWPSRLSLAGAMLAVLAWSALEVAFILGLVVVDVEHAAIGTYAVQSVLLGLIGLWIAGASLLAGRWLPLAARSLGILSGIGTVVLAAGFLHGGVNDGLADVGGAVFRIVLPGWAFLLGRVFGGRGSPAAAPTGTPAAAGAAAA